VRPHGEANVWWPIAEALQACEIAADDPLPVATQLCSERGGGARPARHLPDVRRVADGLLYLMGFEVPLREIDPQRAREEATRAVLTFIEGAARAKPVVVVLSDLHWADSLVLDMISAITDRLSRQRVALVATARQSLTERWSVPTGRHNTVVVNFDPLEREATGELLDALVPGDVEPAIRAALLDRSGGNPFFLEELVAPSATATWPAPALRRAAGGALGDLPTPSGAWSRPHRRPHAGRAGHPRGRGRLGRSGPVMALAKMAEAPPRCRRASIDLILRGLADKEILRIDGGHWAFRSDLIREVAYGTLTKADRARRHHGIASSRPTWSARRSRPTSGSSTWWPSTAAAAELAPSWARSTASRPRCRPALDWLEERPPGRRGPGPSVAERLHSQALRLLGPERTSRRVQLLLGRAGCWPTCATSRPPVPTSRRPTPSPSSSATSPASPGRCSSGARSSDNGDLAMAIGTLAEAVDHFRALGDEQGAADAIRRSAWPRSSSARTTTPSTPCGLRWPRSREAGDRRGEAWALQHLAWISFVEGRVDEAESRIARSAQTFSELGDLGGLGWATACWPSSASTRATSTKPVRSVPGADRGPPTATAGARDDAVARRRCRVVVRSRHRGGVVGP
jgi:hypothetical protein